MQHLFIIPSQMASSCRVERVVGAPRASCEDAMLNPGHIKGARFFGRAISEISGR